MGAYKKEDGITMIKKTFTSAQEAKKFWDAAAYDVLDIILALNDMGLAHEAFTFSVHFGEPDLMQIYTNFMLDFKAVKKMLGVPEVYAAEDTIITTSIEEMKEPKRDVSTITVSKQYMQAAFALWKQDFAADQKQMMQTLSERQQKLLSQGKLKPEDIKPLEINSVFEAHFTNKQS